MSATSSNVPSRGGGRSGGRRGRAEAEMTVKGRAHGVASMSMGAKPSNSGAHTRAGGKEQV